MRESRRTEVEDTFCWIGMERLSVLTMCSLTHTYTHTQFILLELYKYFCPFSFRILILTSTLMAVEKQKSFCSTCSDGCLPFILHMKYRSVQLIFYNSSADVQGKLQVFIGVLVLMLVSIATHSQGFVWQFPKIIQGDLFIPLFSQVETLL